MKLTDEVLRQISTDTGWSFYTVREIVSAIPERPAPAPAPAPQQDDVAVVKRMLCAFYPATEHIFSLAQYERMTDALAVARRGMVPRTEGTYTLEEVVKAVRVYCVLQGWSLCVVNALIDDLRARLTAAPKPTKQDAAVEAVREVLAPYRNHSRPEIELSVFEDVVAAVRKADREAHNG
jgi:hypothetical protein